jgi:hypothetical protein
MLNCQCRACAERRLTPAFRWPRVPLAAIVCDLCSDKRCAHGDDHRNICNLVVGLIQAAAKPNIR